MALLSTKTGLPSFSVLDNAIVNYFTDGGFERGTNAVIPSGWAQYNDGAVAVPVDGTGGSAVAQVTMLCSNSSPIRGTLSAVISKDANNRQGVGYSFDFTISNADNGITAGVNFELLTSANYVSGDMVFYIYDVTNSILITPRSVSLPALPSYGKFFSDYGLTAGTSYRFILHIATTSALAYTVTLDTMVNTTTRVAVPGPVISNWVSWTPTGSWNTNVTYSGKYRIVGNVAEFQVTLTLTGAPNAADLTVSLPSNLTIDTSSLPTLGAYTTSLGVTRIYDNATAGYVGGVVYTTTTAVYITHSTSGTNLGIVNATTPITFASGDAISARFTVPVVQFLGSSSNFGPGASIEYLSTDFSAFAAVRTSLGTALPTTTPAGTNEQIDMGALPWLSAQQSIDSVDIEIQQAGTGPWLPLPNADIAILTFDGTNYIGLGILYTGGTYKMIRGKYRAAGSGTWASIAAGTRYRVLKARPDSPVGQLLAGTDGREGLYKAGQAPGLTTGIAIPSLYVGEMPGTLSSGTGGFTYKTNTTTNWTNSAASVVSYTLNKGVYIVSAMGKFTANAGGGNCQFTLRVGGTTVTGTQQFGTTASAETTWTCAAVPIVISTDSTAVAVYGISGAGNTSNTTQDLFIARIA